MLNDRISGTLFGFQIVLFFKGAVGLALRTKDNFDYKLIIGMVAAYMLGSLFGADFRDPVNGPIAWLAIGWMIWEVADHLLGSIPAQEST